MARTPLSMHRVVSQPLCQTVITFAAIAEGDITSDAVFNFFDNLLPDSPIYVTGSLNVIMLNPDNRLIYCRNRAR